jgi:tripartite-type tricarboxylate transporter receptor subunit TctC
MTKRQTTGHWLRRTVLALPAALIGAAVLASAPAAAQTKYPEKPIRIIVPFSAGGASDTLARLVGQKMQEAWGQPVVVENKPGAGGNIGADFVAKSDPDGYTLLLSAAGFMSVNPWVYPNLSYNPAEFTPLTLLVKAPLLLVVKPDLPVKDIKEFVAYVKANPGKVNIGNGGNGTAQHMGGVYLAGEAKIDVAHVPYKGSAPATTDLLAGITDAQFDNMVTLVPYVKQGKLKALAVSSLARSGALPEVPTIAETILPGFETGTWYGIVGPAGIPAPVADKISAELRRIVALPEIKEKLAGMGLEPDGLSGAQYGAFIKSELAKYEKIVKASGLKIQ